jgi:branched-chain amino acid transport system ATP-binding protein
VLVAEGLSKSFGGLDAVSSVDISLRHGELHAVIGPNGAGKSTLANLLSGELSTTAGRILLDGRDVTRQPAYVRVHHGIARSFQRTDIFKSLTTLENVRLAVQAVAVRGLQALRWPGARHDLVERAMAALVRVGLGDDHGRIAGTLAHGEQRQLEIAMTLASDPKVLLLDEPLAGMGTGESERIAELLQALARERAILLIEHDMDFVFKVADRMTVLVEGRVLATGSPQEVRANRDVQAAYLGGAT